MKFKLPPPLIRLFTPHHTNNHRSHLLQPVGMAVLIGLLLITNSSLELVKAVDPEGFVLGYASNITVDQVLTQTNAQRASHGLPALEYNQQLASAALAKANDMFQNDYWAHTSPSGATPWVFIRGSGYRYTVAGENLARDFDDTPSMVTAWMNSPTHQANIIHPKYTQTGIAVVNGKLGGIETTLVVHMFGTPSSAVATKPPPPKLASGTDTATASAPVPPPPAQTPEENVPPPALPDTSVLSEAQSSQAKIISPITIKKSIAFSMVVLLIAILVIDEVIINRRQTVRFVGKNWAHLGFLGAILLIILLTTQGGVI